MTDTAFMTYPPLDTPKPVADGVWIVDGPTVRFGFGPISMPFPTRATIIRLPGGRLFVHSPTALTEDLRAAVDGLGTVAWIIAPNRIHYTWVPDWHADYPSAGVWLAPRIREQAEGHAKLDFPAEELEGAARYPWDDAIATLPAPGDYMTEFVFFHRESRTLILTDLIENFEADKLPHGPMGLLVRLDGAADPHGGMPRDMRLTYYRHRDALRTAVETMVAWSPERVILAHGRWFDRDGTAELERAFAWLLD